MDYRTKFMMESLTLFTLSIFLMILIFLECHGEERRIRAYGSLKIKDPADRENTLVNQILTEKQQFFIANQRVGALVQQKIEALTKYHSIKIPLEVRNYALMMEDRFGKTVNDQIPADVHKLAIQIKNYDSHIRERMYKWWNIIETKADDEYIQLIIAELHADFKRRVERLKLVAVIGDVTYKKYILSFCEAIARACDRVNDLIAHVQSGAEIRLEKRGFFDAVVDDKMTIFYNALVGTKIVLVSTSTSTTQSANNI